MTFTNITVGRMTLRESFELSANIAAGTDTRTLVLAGQESSPPLTFAQVKQRQEDILGLQNRLVPIQFGTKSDHDGWYQITDVNTSVVDYQNSEVRAFNWGLNADFIGPENGVDIESRLTTVSRINDHGLTGEKWHAPAGNSNLYYTGVGTKPTGSVSRATSDGTAVTVWRSVPASAHARWYSDLADYGIGRCRILDAGVERVGVNIDVGSTTFMISNGVVSASMSASAGTSWTISAWDGSAWDSKDWNVGFSSSTNVTNTFDGGVTVLRNDYEAVAVRFADNDSGGGRRVVDWTLRRGSRFIEGYIQMDESGTLAIWPSAAEASTATASTGYVRATNNDAQGNRYVCGSARSFTGLTASGGLSKASATTLDFFIGAEVGGSAAVTGDQAANLVAQYLTAVAEKTLAAVR